MTNEDINSIKSEIAYRIYNSSVQKYPFAHSETNNLLPRKFLDELLANWPKSDEFKSNIETSSVKVFDKANDKHSFNFRHQICLTDDKEISQLKEERINFWKNFAGILNSKEITQALVALYSQALLRRFQFKNPSALFTEMKYKTRLHLLHDKTNYALGPHTDNEGKVVVILIYFESDEEDNTQSSFGTSVYIPKERGFVCNTGEHHERDKFIRVYSAQFIKNNAFSFCRSNNSFHGVEKVKDKAVERKLLQLSLYGMPSQSN